MVNMWTFITMKITELITYIKSQDKHKMYYKFCLLTWANSA